MTEAVVLWGSNNIFHVEPLGNEEELSLEGGLPQGVECRIKGKQLSGTDKGYNPLAPGDRVRVHLAEDGRQGLIEERLDRRNEFVRWNRKRNAIQTIAANLDLLVGIASPCEPPFRPRFIDRVAVAAELGEIPFAVLLNKCDQGVPAEVRARLESFEALGYQVLETSVLTGRGVEAVGRWIEGKDVAFLGQSGVGKSSLLNAIAPEIGARVGEVSKKYNRGRHTTTLAVRVPLPDRSAGVVDTPGIREIDLYAFPRERLAWGFPEMREHIPECRIPGCTHLHEPDCAVITALERGEIDPDRYESYQRIMIEHELSRKLAGEHRYAAGR
ncbi:MAG: ribosome small subunit-dependent GTPase A [Spirochaetaceae bacterium]